MKAVDFVSAPGNLYPSTKSAASKQLLKKTNIINASLGRLSKQLNLTAKQLAAIANESSSNQSGVSQVANAIAAIKNNPVPQLGALANPGSASVGTPTGAVPTQSATVTKTPIVQLPVPQVPAATTRASQLG